ncbi:recombinase family protein [Chloroflexota bacterium]
MSAAIYSRVSTEDQEKEGSSLDSQQEACLKFAEEKGYEISGNHILREVWSGLTLDRSDLQQLRDWVRDGEVDAVVVYSTDRLSRDPLHLLLLVEEFDKKGVQLHFVTEPMDNSMEGQLLGFVRGWASKLEALRIRERTMRGKLERAKSGKLPGASHSRLYGYDYEAGEKKELGIRIINEEQARWVREMFRWLVEEGLSVRAITLRLTALGIPNWSGKTFWHQSTVHDMLTNPAYYGLTYAFTRTQSQAGDTQALKQKKGRAIWKPREEWIEIPGVTPPIISEDLFEAAQAKLKRNREMSPRRSKRQYLLRGHIRCRNCGRSYCGDTVIRGKGAGRRFRRIYRCSGKIKTVTPVRCTNKLHGADQIETAVWEQVENILLKPETVTAELGRRRQEAMDTANTLEENLESVNKRMIALTKREERLIKLYTFGEFDEKLVKQEKAKLDTERHRLEEEKRSLKGRISQVEEWDVDAEAVERFCKLASQNIQNFTYEDRCLTLETLQIKAWIDGDSVILEGAIPVSEEPKEGCIVSVTSG